MIIQDPRTKGKPVLNKEWVQEAEKKKIGINTLSNYYKYRKASDELIHTRLY